jgi:adenosylcobinamide kinase / adenosylcobinamide-phosphate guanylyltransferase
MLCCKNAALWKLTAEYDANLMKTLFIGGIKSGKSRLAEDYTLRHATVKPYYLATTEFFDEEMRERISVHQQRRQDHFVTVEEAVDLSAALDGCQGTVLIECVSMWLNNLLHRRISENRIFQELDEILDSPLDLIMVINDVGAGIVPDNQLARQFVDLSGKASQLLGERCDEVYFCCAGISVQIK